MGTPTSWTGQLSSASCLARRERQRVIDSSLTTRGGGEGGAGGRGRGGSGRGFYENPRRRQLSPNGTSLCVVRSPTERLAVLRQDPDSVNVARQRRG